MKINTKYIPIAVLCVACGLSLFHNGKPGSTQIILVLLSLLALVIYQIIFIERYNNYAKDSMHLKEYKDVTLKWIDGYKDTKELQEELERIRSLYVNERNMFRTLASGMKNLENELAKKNSEIRDLREQLSATFKLRELWLKDEVKKVKDSSKLSIDVTGCSLIINDCLTPGRYVNGIYELNSNENE